MEQAKLQVTGAELTLTYTGKGHMALAKEYMRMKFKISPKAWSVMRWACRMASQTSPCGDRDGVRLHQSIRL